MRRLLWLLALCALAVGISLAARFNQRYILLVLPPYRAELSLHLAICSACSDLCPALRPFPCRRADRVTAEPGPIVS